VCAHVISDVDKDSFEGVSLRYRLLNTRARYTVWKLNEWRLQRARISCTVSQWDCCLLPLWSRKMPNKCCVGNCKSNYDSDKDFVPSYHFPKDPEERERWRNALPNIIQVGLCEMKLYFIFTIAYKMWWLVNVKFNGSLNFLLKSVNLEYLHVLE